MNWHLVVLVVAVLLVTLVLYLKHQGDLLCARIFEVVVQRNRLVVSDKERDWCLGKLRSRWSMAIFLGMITAGMKLLFPGDADVDNSMIEAALPRCEDGVVHLLMHYRQEHAGE